MSELAGITGNGFDYSAAYPKAVQGSVVRAATYRWKGGCHGYAIGAYFRLQR